MALLSDAPAVIDHQEPEARRPPETDSPAGVGATLLLALLTLAAGAGYDRVFADHRWILPVVAVGLAVHLVSWGARRRHLATGWGMLVGLAATLVISIWTVVGATTVVGLPLGETWTTVHLSLDNARRVLPTVNAPVPDLVGFRLVAAWGIGIVALLGDWAGFRVRSALQALTPAFALFVVCCVLGRTAGRLWATVIIVATMAMFVLVHRNTVGRAGTVWFAGRHHGALGWRIGIGAGVLAVIGAGAVVPILSPTEGHGVLGWKHGPSGSSGARSVISPIVDLPTRLLNEANKPVMTVTSSVPSYWRLTSLDTFTGVQWQSTNSYLAIGRRLPGVSTSPPGTRQVVEQFHLQSLDSIWLPAAFDPQSVSGGGQVTYDPISGSLLTSRATANGLNYTVTSRQYLATLDTRALQAAALPAVAGSLAHDVALPALPGGIHGLAVKVTAGKRTEYDKALALQNFFYGPSFHYSTNPPTDGYGTNALSTFLFDTRTGYCQQFAGAYAVLARSIGLPTRLAVGFTTGAPNGAGYQVTDADAHTWPEVYFPGYGWLPFEPTKGGFQVPGAAGYTGNTADVSSPAPRPRPVPVSPATTAPSQAPTASPTTTPPLVPTPAPAARRVGRDLGGGLAIAVGAAGAIAAWVALIVGGRAMRWHRRRRPGGGSAPAQVMSMWGETEELLAWWGLRRRPEETFTDLARRAGSMKMDSVQVDLDALARWATEADYAAGTSSSATVDQARAARSRIGSELHSRATFTRRLQWWSDPRLAWRPHL